MQRMVGILICGAFLSGSIGSFSEAQELGPYFPISRAPLEVRKGEAPLSSLTQTEAREVAGEFKGLLYYGARKYPYEKWPGKEMSDCLSSTSQPWSYQCEMITGHANAFYYFYRDPAHPHGTLQQVDVRFNVADDAILRELKRPLRSLFGEGVYRSKATEEENAWGVSAPSWRWTTPQDLAYLYMDAGPDGEALARFQWRRSPLLSPLTTASLSRSGN